MCFVRFLARITCIKKRAKMDSYEYTLKSLRFAYQLIFWSFRSEFSGKFRSKSNISLNERRQKP